MRNESAALLTRRVHQQVELAADVLTPVRQLEDRKSSYGGSALAAPSRGPSTATPTATPADAGGVRHRLRGGVEAGRCGRAGPVEDDGDGVGEAEVLAAEVGEGHVEPVGHEGEQVLSHRRYR